MPHRKLTDTERRRLTLAALSRASPSDLAKEYGVSRSHVYKLREEARRHAEEEAEFWMTVRQLVRVHPLGRG